MTDDETTFWASVPNIHDALAESTEDIRTGSTFATDEVRASLDMQRESRAWASARNVPDDVVVPRLNGLTPWQYRDGVMSEREFLWGSDTPAPEVDDIPGFREHTEAAVRRIAHNSIVHMDSREQALGDLAQALALLFDDDDPRDLTLKLPAVRRAWTAWKDTL